MPRSATARNITSLIKENVKTTLVLDSRSVYNRLANVSDDTISKNWHNIDVTNLQQYSSQRLFKLFAANDTSFSSSLLTHIRMLEDNYQVTAFKPNRSRFEKGQNYLDELRERFDFTDKYDGFALSNTIKDQINRMARNILTSDNAAGALFVNLDSQYETDEFQVIDCDLVRFGKKTPDVKKDLPFIFENGQKVWLDFANFLWQPMDSDAGKNLGNNLLRPALKTTFTKMEFLDNLRKVLRNHAWPKIKVTLDEQAVIKIAPPEVKSDPKQLIEFMNDYIGKVEDQLTGIDPEQNIIVYNTISDISFLESSRNIDPTPIAKLLDSELISGGKTPPSTVGKGGSTRTAEGLASAELVIFRRCIKAIRALVETLYSRSFTLSLRLKGLRGYAEFKLDEFSLRAPEESAQYDSIRQDNIIDAWVVGAIGDDEKDVKIRKMHGLDTNKPSDAGIKEDPRNAKKDIQTERTPVSRDSKEQKRQQTREDKKGGADKQG